ncbi:MAG: hypothetical protein NVSMB19_18410 [Vulcanimicrobiaceae bacterium]
MIRLRALRLLWPLLFIVPLWLAVGKRCWSRPMHAVVDGTLLLHQYLPFILVGAGTAAVIVVCWKIARVRASLGLLKTLGGSMPDALRCAVAAEAAAAGMPEPALTFLDVEMPICYTVMPGPAILISRGFIAGLVPAELALVIRHELVHVRHRDPLRGLLWHLAFSALLVPGFGGLERWLYDRRERRTNALAGAPGDARFDALARRVRHAELGVERSLGNAYAGALRRGPAPRFVFLRPALATGVFSALLASHYVFMSALPALERHHC